VIVMGILLIAAALGTGAAATAATGSATLSLSGIALTTSPGRVFLSGAGSAAVVLLGLLLIHQGVARLRRRRRQIVELRAATLETQTAEQVTG